MNVRLLFTALLMVASAPANAEMPNRNGTHSDFSAGTPSGTNRPDASMPAPPAVYALAQLQNMPTTPPALNATGITGFFFTGPQTQKVLAAADWLANSISPEQFPDPLLEWMSILAVSLLEGPMPAGKITEKMAKLPNGQMAKMSTKLDSGMVVTPQLALANAASRFNNLVQRAATSNPAALEEPNVAAVRDLLMLLTNAYTQRSSQVVQ